jgi:hypothetical protein
MTERAVSSSSAAAGTTGLSSINQAMSDALGTPAASSTQPTPQEIAALFGGQDVATAVGGGATLTRTGATSATPQSSTAPSPSATTGADAAGTDPLISAIVAMSTRLSQATDEAEVARIEKSIEVLAGLIARDTTGGDTPAAPVSPVRPDTGSGSDDASAVTLRLVDAMVAITGQMGADLDATRLERYSNSLETLASLVESSSAAA